MNVAMQLPSVPTKIAGETSDAQPRDSARLDAVAGPPMFALDVTSESCSGQPATRPTASTTATCTT